MELLEKTVEPDVEGLLKVLRRTSQPERVYNIELFLDDEIKEQVCKYFDLGKGINQNSPFVSLERDIKLHSFLGYDVFRVSLINGKGVFMFNSLIADDTTSEQGQGRGQREWCDSQDKSISRGWGIF